MTELRFFVAGIPVPQGSMTCMGAVRDGAPHRLIPSNQTKLNTWRRAVIERAQAAAHALGWRPLDCAETRIVFRFARPQNHYRTGRNAHLLRDDAPDYPTVFPDIDKALRAIFDSLTMAHVITDDAVIITSTEAKRYCQPGQRPGVNVVISTPKPLQPTLTTGDTDGA